MKRRGLAGALAVAISIGCVATEQRREEDPPDALLEQAEALYAQADYAGAVRAYEDHVSVRPDDPRSDQVLWRLGMIYLVYGAPDRDSKRGEQNLRELSDRFPSSPFREAADYVLALRQEVAELRSESEQHKQEILTIQSQIEAMKRIDLESDSPR
jgi:outer membrane protein assembly factor BamD (BamD/ComL family)